MMMDEHSPKSRRGRLFEAGRMKLLVLYLIAQSPKHGYEIIKDIAELVGGDYTPSAGTIYPTLNWLETMHFIGVTSSSEDRKQYYVTLQGTQHLTQQQGVVQQLLEKLQLRREIHNNDALIDIHRAMENLKASLRLKLQGNTFDPEQVRIIADKIDQAAVDIARLNSIQ